MTVILRRASKAEARYTPEGGRERCAFCRHFMSQGSCGRILGPVSARGWCKYYSVMVEATPGDVSQAGGPQLDLNFTTMTTLDPRITFTRNSVATYFDNTGMMQTAAANVARFDNDPVTHAPRGLLIEESRTNVLLNSATLATQNVTTTATAYSLSFYGTGSVTLSGTSSGTTTGTGATTRVTATFTPTAGTLTLTVAGSVTNAQLETGAFPTSYIPTTGAAVTRAADVATMPLAAAIPCSAVVDAMTPYASPNAQGLLLMDDGTTSNRILLRINPTNVTQAVYVSGGSATIQLSVATMTPGQVFKLGGSFVSSGINACLNGGAVVNGSGAGPSGLTTLRLGQNSLNLGFDDGYIRRVRYWNRALTNAQLQQVTT